MPSWISRRKLLYQEIADIACERIRDAPLNLIVEIKGYRGEDAKVKAETMKT